MPSSRLILFDIDGTMLLTHGIGRTMLSRAFGEVIGRDITIDGIPFSGRTDQNIAWDVAELNGVDADSLHAVVSEVLRKYEGLWTSEWESVAVEELPGVGPLVEQLAGFGHVHLALVTGNVRPVAYHKLKCIGMDHHFPDGGFGSDSPDRNQLPGIAVRRMSERTGRSWDPSNVVVVGDTPRDVRCAQEIGARTIAVCTGYYSREELAAAGADFVLDNLLPESGIMSLLTNGALS